MVSRLMKISDASLKARLARFPAFVPPQIYKLPVSSATVNVQDKFVCKVCENIAYKCSKGCGLCFTYCCEHCLTTSLKENNQCPNPQCQQDNPGQEYISAAKMHPAD